MISLQLFRDIRQQEQLAQAELSMLIFCEAGIVCHATRNVFHDLGTLGGIGAAHAPTSSFLTMYRKRARLVCEIPRSETLHLSNRHSAGHSLTTKGKKTKKKRLRRLRPQIWSTNE